MLKSEITPESLILARSQTQNPFGNKSIPSLVPCCTRKSRPQLGDLVRHVGPLETISFAFVLVKLFFFLFAAVSFCHFRWVCVLVARAPRKIG